MSLRIPTLTPEKNYVVLLESKHSGGQIKKAMVKKKLRKARNFCLTLAKNFGKFLSEKDKLELDVLLNLIESAYFLEKRRFQEAKASLLHIIGRVAGLQKAANVIEKAHLQELIDNSKQSLRFCKFQLKEYDAGEEEIIFDIQDQREMERVLERRASKANSKRVLDILGEPIEIEDPLLVAALVKTQMLQRSLENNLGASGEEDLFWALMEGFDEGIRRAKKNKAEAGNNVALSAIWEKVENCLMLWKNQYLLRRHLKYLKAHELKNKQEDISGIQKMSKKGSQVLDTMLLSDTQHIC